MKNKKRMFVYLAVFCVLIALVIRQRGMVTYERTKDIVTITSLWEKEGKPVRTRKAVRCPIVKDQKLTLVREDDGLFYGYVTSEVREKVKLGQDVYMFNNGHEKYGTVNEVGEDRDMNAGLYKIRVDMSKALGGEDKIVAYIENRSDDECFAVSNNVIDIDEGGEYLWKMVDGKAVREEVEVGERYGNMAVVAKGINEGDLVIVEGHKQLAQFDKVRDIDEQ